MPGLLNPSYDEAAHRLVFGGRLKRLRCAKGWSPQKLADLVGINEKSIRNWEAGLHWPPVERQHRLAEALGVDHTSLMSRETDADDEPVAARVVDTYDDLPETLVQLLAEATRSLKGIRVAAKYGTAANVQLDFRRELEARLRARTFLVQRAEIVYSLGRLKEIIWNIANYTSDCYQIKAYCSGLQTIAPSFGGYIFDDKSFVLGAYWEESPPPKPAPGLLLSGTSCALFFRAYWNEIWRRGIWLNENGAENLDRVRDIAMQLGLQAGHWPTFVDQARALRIADGGPPLF